MPEYCAERSSKILSRYQKSMKGSKILVLGVVCKQDIEELEKEGAEVLYFDPYV